MMSTRSGKRIHSSISENIESLSEIRIERNTRSKRGKENSGEIAIDKTKNFVRRPSCDEVESTQHETDNSSKSVRKSRRRTLKALNTPAVDYDALNDQKSIRKSRRTLKEGTIQPTNVLIQESIEVVKEKKKNRKKRAVIENLENEPVIITKKKTNKKKRKSNSFIVEELATGERNKSLNKSNVSIDSFHSAAGSPDNIKDDNLKIEDKSPKNRDKNESSAVTSNHSVKNGKGSKKKSKKTEKDKYFETSINKSVKLSASNESFESSVNKKEEIEVKDVNIFEKEMSGSFKTNSKQKRSKERNFLSDTENTNTKTELIHNMELNNSLEANIHSTDLKKNSNDKNKIINTSASNMDFINIPQANGTVSPFNNSSKKKRKSNSKNSTADKIDTSITLLNKCNNEISDNTVIETKKQLDEITINTTGSENPRKSKSQDATYEKINLSDTNLDKTFDKINNSFNKNSSAVKELSHNRSSRRESSFKNTTYDKIDDNDVDMDTTFNKDPSNNSNAGANSTAKKRRRSSRVSVPQGVGSTILNGTYDKISKDDNSSFCNNTYDKPKSDTTFERSKDNLDGDSTINLNSKASLMSSDNTDNMTSDMSEDCSRISVTSDDSRTENIINTTPLLIESSMDESQTISASILLNKTTTPQKEEAVPKIITPDKQESASDYKKTSLKREGTFSETKTTPLKREGTYTELRKTPTKHRTTLTEREEPTPTLKREGTFTKESPDVTSPKSKTVDRTPTRRESMPSPGRTPFSSSRSGSRGRVPLNVTHSIEKSSRRSSAAAAPPRLTRVMFRSPVDNPVAVAQIKGKVIKSNLKGSSKSFILDESVLEQCGLRRRSRTQGCGPGAASRPAPASHRARTASAAARLQAPVEAEVASPASKSGAKSRTKLPDFAALHQKQFSKMESLDECQRRRARRARALLTPTSLHAPTATLAPTAPLAPTASLTPIASLTHIAKKGALHANKPQETSDTVHSQAEKRPVTQKSKDIDTKNQSYTRFGFKLNMDVNPFSVPAKTGDIHPKDVIKNRQATLPSLAGTTQRKEAARQAVMREKSFTDKRHVDRHQNRTVIKGVRTNRRFELQMKMRNID